MELTVKLIQLHEYVLQRLLEITCTYQVKKNTKPSRKSHFPPLRTPQVEQVLIAPTTIGRTTSDKNPT